MFFILWEKGHWCWEVLSAHEHGIRTAYVRVIARCLPAVHKCTKALDGVWLSDVTYI